MRSNAAATRIHTNGMDTELDYIAGPEIDDRSNWFSRHMMKKSLLTVLIVALGISCGVNADAVNKTIPSPTVDTPAAEATGPQVAVLAGGCFWGQQGMFEHVKGVTKGVAGYSGGEKSTAHYEMVGTETTGHAESVEITFDPKQVSYGQLLQLYFSVAHDPTELDRQGPDSGPSYRSEIFFATPTQERIARAYVAQLTQAKIYSRPIVTRIEPLKAFYAAEGYHQDYLIHHPTQPYIVFNDLPKIDALKRTYPQLYRPTPVELASAR
jgi:peptide-methionine (S)-S-oxide reductase